jgi:FkbM family methyltransferase
MEARVFLRFFIILIKIFTIGISLLMIPIILLVSALLPWKGIVSLFLFILPLLLLVLWIIRMILCGKLRRKESPVSFYTVFIVSAIFWLVFSGVSTIVSLKKTDVYLKTMTPKKMIALTTDILNDIFRIESQKTVGLFLNENQKRQLFQDYTRFYSSIFFPFLRDQNDIRILNYHVKSFGFFDTGVLFQEIFINQQYFFKTNTPTPWIIDCGSHIGLSILYFKALYPQARLLAFEPAPETFKLLRENVKRNLLKNVRLENKAVSNEEGKIKFYGDKSKTSSLIKERGSGEGIEVDVVRLSKYIDRTVDFLKIDVEGAEHFVLDDLVASGKLGMVSQLVIEYHHHIAKDTDRLSKFLKFLEDHNFGYQIEGSSQPPYKRMEYEDIMIYAYQK